MIDPCEVDQLKLYFKINDEKASELSGIYKNNLVSIDALFYMTITKRSVTEKTASLPWATNISFSLPKERV